MWLIMPRITFDIMDDLRSVNCKLGNYNTTDELRQFINECWEILIEDHNLYWGKSFNKDKFIEKVIQELDENKYVCYNRVEKYYVVYFQIDDTSFYAWSKDQDKELIGTHPTTLWLVPE